MEIELWIAVDSENRMVTYARFLWALYQAVKKDDLKEVVKIERIKVKIDYKPRNDLPF